MITWPALTLPHTRAFSLMTSMLVPSSEATTSPCTSPSIRRPSLKRSSPWITVPSPIRLRIVGAFFFPNMAVSWRLAPPSQFDALRGAHAAVAIGHLDLNDFYHGLSGHFDRPFDPCVLPHAQRLRAAGRGVAPRLAVQRAAELQLVTAAKLAHTLAALRHQELVAQLTRCARFSLQATHVDATARRRWQQALEEA